LRKITSPIFSAAKSGLAVGASNGNASTNLDARTGTAIVWFFLNIRLEHNCFVFARALAFSSPFSAPCS
jgi:hypothetical protein